MSTSILYINDQTFNVITYAFLSALIVFLLLKFLKHFFW